MLVGKIEALGVQVHLNKNTKEIIGNGKVEGMAFADGARLDVEMIVVSAGIKPRDDLARACGLTVGQRGGVVVDDHLRTSDPDIYAIGEVAPVRRHDLRPGRARLRDGRDRRRQPGRPGARLQGRRHVHQAQADGRGRRQLRRLLRRRQDRQGDHLRRPVQGIPTRSCCSAPTAPGCSAASWSAMPSEYGKLSMLAKSSEPLADDARRSAARQAAAMPRRGGRRWSRPSPTIRRSARATTSARARSATAIRDKNLRSVDEVKALHQGRHRLRRLLAAGHRPVQGRRSRPPARRSTTTCASTSPARRQELFEIVKIKRIKSFDELIHAHGRGQGCEICKPAVASILASLWNENVLEHTTIQDTNDRFLANIQRGGIYSVVPRVPGGEITPDKLIALGTVAKKYGLYTKITGGQRIDLFGAAGAPAARTSGKNWSRPASRAAMPTARRCAR